MHHPSIFSDVHPDLIVAGFTIVLALVQILWAAAARTNELGLKWNAGPRDGEVAPPGVAAGRLIRAQINLMETLPLFLGAVALVHLADKQGELSMWGTHLFLLGRVIYLPLYRFGVTGLRTAAWMLSLVGLGMTLYALFT
ncbi:MAPEG family protein [Brevundimonas aveniformis]|uniref:MAPEG family protein n=1 Tax=Brevundimonas aveniformis TaxID=370977 RepID=UPI000422D85B|nr:MAPEG family protein [Brevundimonas aveniformis]